MKLPLIFPTARASLYLCVRVCLPQDYARPAIIVDLCDAATLLTCPAAAPAIEGLDFESRDRSGHMLADQGDDDDARSTLVAALSHASPEELR
jgi:hypothetical protein